MALPIILAKHSSFGVWNFSCPLHDEPWETTAISSPRHAVTVLKAHLDKMHPGVSARLKVESDYSGTKVSTYTSPANIEPGDKL